jgi:septum formation protein
LLARPVLSADTTLEFAGEIIGKPQDAADAEAILRRLSGQTHRVLTGVALHFQGQTDFMLSTSCVSFRHLENDEILHYVRSGEPMDKAGAYGIQGRAGLFVQHLAGSYSGVMGLPVCETGELLKRVGWRF